MHQGMRGVGLDGRGVCIADLCESCVHPLGAPIDEVHGIRRNVDETDPRPVHRGRQFDRARRWIGSVSNRRWTALRAPHFMEDCSRQCGEVRPTVGSGPSEAIIAWPSALCPVTIRRIVGNDGSSLIDQAPFGSCGMLRIGACGACTFEKSKTAIAATMTAATPRGFRSRNSVPAYLRGLGPPPLRS